ncbi:hypothetical protein [Paenibacillus sp. CMAA1364]
MPLTNLIIRSFVRGALFSLLSLEDDIEVVAEAADGQATWEAIQ